MPTAKQPIVTELIRPRWAHLEYSWQLENFWELRALACVEALEDDGSLIWSQPFGDQEKGVWQLKLYPYGDLSPAGRGHISLFLSLDLKSLSRAYAVFGCYLLDEEGNKIANSGRSFTRQKFAEGSSSWGWSQFIKAEGQTLNKLMTFGDSLVIKCEIEVFTGMLSSPPKNFDQMGLGNGVAHASDALTWEAELKAHLCNPKNYNVTLLCEGREIRAHREILRARSKWFAEKLQSSSASIATCAPKQAATSSAAPTAASTPANAADLGYASFGVEFPAKETAKAGSADDVQSAPTCSNVVVVENIRVDVVENIVQYTHTDDCTFLEAGTPLRDLLDLLVAAKELQIPSIYKAVLRRLCTLLTSKAHALTVQEVAKRIGDRELEQHCTSYLMLCVRDLSRDEIIKTLSTK